MRSLIKIFFLVAFPLLGFTQTQTTVFTPKGSAVSDTYVVPEFSSSQIAAGNNFVATSYPNATRLTDASATYNCHGYAWHISEGGNNVWIGYYTAAAEDIYWSDGSYVEVCNQTFPAKVSYASDNHSAITTNQTDIFKSKWGQLPVMQHNKDYTPYNSSVLKYYGKISGSNLVCGSEQFSIGAISGISWSSSNTAGLSINSTTGFATRQNSFNGQVTITATIAQACGNVTITQNVWVGVPSNPNTIPSGSNIITMSPAQVLNVTASATTATSFSWSYTKISGSFANGLSLYPYGPMNQSCSIEANRIGDYTVFVSASNACGSTQPQGRILIRVRSGSGGAMRTMAVFPNPSSEFITVKLKETESEDIASVILTNNSLEKVYSIQTKETEVTIPTQALPDGTYYLNIQVGKETVQRQIIVNH